jgi:hypothetical protein
MRYLVAVALTLALAAPASAAGKRYGAWSVEDLGTYTEAHTSNDSGSVFGLLCGTECVFYLNVLRGCTEGELYPAMINSKAGAYPIELKCFVLDKDYVLTFAAGEEHADIFVKGGTIGFALPIDGGAFGVSRFSLNGSLEATMAASAMAERKDGKRRDGLRDFTI